MFLTTLKNVPLLANTQVQGIFVILVALSIVLISRLLSEHVHVCYLAPKVLSTLFDINQSYYIDPKGFRY